MYECSKCPYKTNHHSNYKSHMQHHSTEEIEDQEKCSFCDYYATTRALIKKHESTHCKLEETFESVGAPGGIKKYACKLCPYKAVNKTKMNI